MRILLILFILVYSCKPVPVSDGKVNGYMGKVCIEGHVYHQIAAYGGATYSIKLDDNGKPIKCSKNQYWEGLQD